MYTIQNNFNIKQWIENNCFTSNGSLNNYCTKDYWWKNRNFLEIKKVILEMTNWLDTDDMTKRLYHLYHNIREIPTCIVCGNICNFKNFKNGYFRLCSRKCIFKDKARNEKISKSNDYKSISEKVKETNLKKYKVPYYILTEEFKVKSRNTKKDRYGNENYNKSEEKILNIDTDYVFNEHNVNKRSYVELSKELGCSEPTISKKMREVGLYGQRFNMQSSYERNLKQYLESKNIEVVISDRKTVKNTEIDLFLPQYNIGIEINGLYWHEEEKRKSKFHINEKMKLLNSYGIDVINIWDSEYINKKDLVLSIVNNRLGINPNKIYARNCQINEISSYEYRNFLEKNHIQGAINSTIRVGLFHNDILVSVMGVGKSRFKKDEVELHRFCNVMNTTINGSSSKLFKYLLTNYKFDNIISYCDSRWFSGKVYEILGFKLCGVSNPNYWYFKKGSLKLESRIKYQKHKLSKLLVNFNNNLTEYENMKMNDYCRVFDCGNKIYRYSKIED